MPTRAEQSAREQRWRGKRSLCLNAWKEGVPESSLLGQQVGICGQTGAGLVGQGGDSWVCAPGQVVPLQASRLCVPRPRGGREARPCPARAGSPPQWAERGGHARSERGPRLAPVPGAGVQVRREVRLGRDPEGWGKGTTASDFAVPQGAADQRLGHAATPGERAPADPSPDHAGPQWLSAVGARGDLPVRGPETPGVPPADPGVRPAWGWG